MTEVHVRKPWFVMGNNRIGRLQIIAYGFGVFLLALPALVLAFALMGSSHREIDLGIFAASALVVFTLDAMLAIRRLHDINASGWWALLQIPGLSFDLARIGGFQPAGWMLAITLLSYAILVIYSLVLIFQPGTVHANRFGPSPAPNSKWVIGGAVGGIVSPVVLFSIAVLFIAQKEQQMAEKMPDNPQPVPVAVKNIPNIVARLAATHHDGYYIVFLFELPGTSDDQSINLQWSEDDNGQLGLDWVLLAPHNVADADRIRAFALQKGFKFTDKYENGVKYLRVEGPGVTDLGMDILEKFYGVPPDVQIGFVGYGVMPN